MSIKRRAREAAARIGLSVDRWPARGTLEELLRLIVTTYGIDSVVDVGANVGQWSTLLRRVGYQGPLLSIEPVDEAYRRLQRRASSDKKWTTLRAAVGDRDGQVEINVAGSTSVSSLLQLNDATAATYPNADQVRAKALGQRAESVPIVTLDSLADRVPGGRIYLKTDTQGYDLQVLEGAKELLNRTLAVQCEMSVRPLYHGMRNDWKSMVAWAEDAGFELAGMFDISRDGALREVEMDGVFVRSQAVVTSR